MQQAQQTAQMAGAVAPLAKALPEEYIKNIDQFKFISGVKDSISKLSKIFKQ